MSKKCGRPCSVYSRVCGYYRPTKNWNDGKREEFKERTTYIMEHSTPLFPWQSEENYLTDVCGKRENVVDRLNMVRGRRGLSEFKTRRIKVA